MKKILVFYVFKKISLVSDLCKLHELYKLYRLCKLYEYFINYSNCFI